MRWAISGSRFCRAVPISVLSMRYHYDNSAANPLNPNHPPKRVRCGDQSTDEMGHLWLQILPRGPDLGAVDALPLRQFGGESAESEPSSEAGAVRRSIDR